MKTEEKDKSEMSKGQRRYSNPAKIEPKGGKGRGSYEEAKGDKDRSTHDQEDKERAESSTKSGKAQAEKEGGADPQANVMSGTDGIQVHERHAVERAEMVSRHQKEIHQAHARHEKEHSSLADRHHSELIKMPEMSGGGVADK